MGEILARTALSKTISEVSDAVKFECQDNQDWDAGTVSRLADIMNVWHRSAVQMELELFKLRRFRDAVQRLAPLHDFTDPAKPKPRPSLHIIGGTAHQVGGAK